MSATVTRAGIRRDLSRRYLRRGQGGDPFHGFPTFRPIVPTGGATVDLASARPFSMRPLGVPLAAFSTLPVLPKVKGGARDLSWVTGAVRHDVA